MIDNAEAQRFIDGIEWPARSKPQLVMGRQGEDVFSVYLYRFNAKPAKRVGVNEDTPERALGAALVLWGTLIGLRDGELEALKARARTLCA